MASVLETQLNQSKYTPLEKHNFKLRPSQMEALLYGFFNVGLAFNNEHFSEFLLDNGVYIFLPLILIEASRTYWAFYANYQGSSSGTSEVSEVPESRKCFYVSRLLLVTAGLSCWLAAPSPDSDAQLAGSLCILALTLVNSAWYAYRAYLYVQKPMQDSTTDTSLSTRLKAEQKAMVSALFGLGVIALGFRFFTEHANIALTLLLISFALPLLYQYRVSRAIVGADQQAASLKADPQPSASHSTTDAKWTALIYLAGFSLFLLSLLPNVSEVFDIEASNLSVPLLCSTAGAALMGSSVVWSNRGLFKA